MPMTAGEQGVARRDPSINDVAREAGVSAQTVSRVATGKDVVRPATRERVIQAMHRLGYRPNSAARALKSGRFHSVGVIMLSLASYGNVRTLEAVATAATAEGYSLTLIPLGAATQASVSGAFARLAEQPIDGIIVVLEAHLLDSSDIDVPTGMPVVVVDAGAQAREPVIDTDQVQGARLATEHLLSLGHATVWHVAGPAESYSAQRRLQSWERALRDHGAVVPDVVRGDWGAESGYRAARRWAGSAEVTAVFAANDEMAVGVLRAFHEEGRSVPGDVSVVGFDDMPESANFWPPLTTVRQHFDEVGRRAWSALVRQIDGERVSPQALVATELVVRASTAPPPRRTA